MNLLLGQCKMIQPVYEVPAADDDAETADIGEIGQAHPAGLLDLAKHDGPPSTGTGACRRGPPILASPPSRCEALHSAAPPSAAIFVRQHARQELTEGFCHVSRRLQRVALPEPSDYAICMMPIAMRAR